MPHSLITRIGEKLNSLGFCIIALEGIKRVDLASNASHLRDKFPKILFDFQLESGEGPPCFLLLDQVSAYCVLENVLRHDLEKLDPTIIPGKEITLTESQFLLWVMKRFASVLSELLGRSNIQDRMGVSTVYQEGDLNKDLDRYIWYEAVILFPCASCRVFFGLPSMDYQKRLEEIYHQSLRSSLIPLRVPDLGTTFSDIELQALFCLQRFMREDPAGFSLFCIGQNIQIVTQLLCLSPDAYTTLELLIRLPLSMQVDIVKRAYESRDVAGGRLRALLTATVGEISQRLCESNREVYKSAKTLFEVAIDALAVMGPSTVGPLLSGIKEKDPGLHQKLVDLLDPIRNEKRICA